MPNGEKVQRDWLVLGAESKCLFCFPCILFLKHNTDNIAPLVDKSKGFSDWQHLNPCIPRHENSDSHIENYIKWKHLKLGKNLIDSDFLNKIRTEKEKWREILRVYLDVILFCAKNNLPLRGHRERVGEARSGVFLGLVEVIGHYNPTIAAHVLPKGERPRTPNYLSHDIQNEFISLLGHSVRREIISEINDATYFSILLDCTPDAGHQEQMCEIIDM